MKRCIEAAETFVDKRAIGGEYGAILCEELSFITVRAAILLLLVQPAGISNRQVENSTMCMLFMDFALSFVWLSQLEYITARNAIAASTY